MEERNELTVSPTGRNECFRTVDILKPSTASTEAFAVLVPDSSSSDSVSKCLKRKSISVNDRRGSPPPGFARKHKDLPVRPFSSIANDRPEVALFEGGSSKCLKGKIISTNDGSDSPPPGFARKHSSEKEQVSGAGIKETEDEVSNSGRCRNNQLQECAPSIEANPSSVKSSTDELILDLEKRITNVEKLCHWITDGKLDMLREIGKQLQKEK